ncbi:hypothetical protein PTTG_00701 [Puccinia triticina 1-1 BBBD Race 1]|uniref:Cytochrome b5 heme-binding domain-containing protein n=1 Tax=Puccinia triticina (isolate 1-1 / race 1 (BBBD)) TaxID=630390 RepID=A0A0C4EIY4_PUCT1|nr:hypothetical protein PTTG_00701 [Puccinia triticina 1-1 BBBD Race 1]
MNQLGLNFLLGHRQQRKKTIILTSTIIFTTITGAYLILTQLNQHNRPIISPVPTTHSTMTAKIISVQEVESHKDEKSAWVIVEGKVYDVTNFLEEHPGGKKVLLKNCGKDATELFHQYHTKK